MFEDNFVPKWQPGIIGMVLLTNIIPEIGDIYNEGIFDKPVIPIEKKQKEIRTRYAAQMAAVASPYQLEERETWFTQLKEADEWLADNTTVTPMLTAMAEARGISVADLVAKIKVNDGLFRQAIGELLGAQQAELDGLAA